VHLGRVEQRAERILPAPAVARRGVEDLRSPAVVERDVERDRRVVRRLGLGQSICSSSAGATRSRRPMNRIRTPSAFSSGVSDRIRCENIRMSAVTSSAGRDQFSVEKE
jgi:hypothetical protein